MSLSLAHNQSNTQQTSNKLYNACPVCLVSGKNIARSRSDERSGRKGAKKVRDFEFVRYHNIDRVATNKKVLSDLL